MNISHKKIVLIILILVIHTALSAQSGNFISLKQRIEILENKNKLTENLDLYFDKEKLIITRHYRSNPEYIMLTNAFGEIKTYYPAKNEVNFNQISELSSKRSLIYYFANNLTEHLGLVDEGFSLISNTFEGQYYVTKWKAPSILSGIETVKMVFENGLPVYSEYNSNQEKILRKIYYTNYHDFKRFSLPTKIIEISYLPAGDSIISRTVFSDVKVSSTADNIYFNYKIPENAKPFNAAEEN